MPAPFRLPAALPVTPRAVEAAKLLLPATGAPDTASSTRPSDPTSGVKLKNHQIRQGQGHASQLRAAWAAKQQPTAMAVATTSEGSSAEEGEKADGNSHDMGHGPAHLSDNAHAQVTGNAQVPPSGESNAAKIARISAAGAAAATTVGGAAALVGLAEAPILPLSAATITTGAFFGAAGAVLTGVSLVANAIAGHDTPQAQAAPEQAPAGNGPVSTALQESGAMAAFKKPGPTTAAIQEAGMMSAFRKQAGDSGATESAGGQPGSTKPAGADSVLAGTKPQQPATQSAAIGPSLPTATVMAKNSDAPPLPPRSPQLRPSVVSA